MTPLNPELHSTLAKHFGQVKIDKLGRRMVREVTEHAGRTSATVLEPGETYRVCCPWCGDSKFKLYVNYTFGTEDPDTGRTYYLNKCYRCGPKTEELKELTIWLSMRNTVTVLAEPGEIDDTPTYTSPGTCVRLDDPRARTGWEYLAGRGIDPKEATDMYSVGFCIEGNPDMTCSMAGRLIFPVTKDGQHVGWQARLAHEPNVFDKDRTFKGLRWYSMPGTWRSQHLLGYDQAKASKFCILVEGPTDLVKQGPPCVASLGQTLSHSQARLIRQTWNHVVIVGDCQKNANGTENTVQRATAKLLLSQGFDSVHMLKLPHGDPGSWSRQDFVGLVAEHVRTNPNGLRSIPSPEPVS